MNTAIKILSGCVIGLFLILIIAIGCQTKSSEGKYTQAQLNMAVKNAERIAQNRAEPEVIEYLKDGNEESCSYYRPEWRSRRLRGSVVLEEYASPYEDDLRNDQYRKMIYYKATQKFKDIFLYKRLLTKIYGYGDTSACYVMPVKETPYTFLVGIEFRMKGGAGNICGFTCSVTDIGDGTVNVNWYFASREDYNGDSFQLEYMGDYGFEADLRRMLEVATAEVFKNDMKMREYGYTAYREWMGNTKDTIMKVGSGIVDPLAKRCFTNVVNEWHRLMLELY